MVGATMTGHSDGPRDAHRIAAFKGFSRVTSLVTMLIGCLVLAGWATDNEVLKRIVPRLVAMNPATALCFILAGLALFLSLSEAANSTEAADSTEKVEGRLRRIAQLLASIVMAVGLLRLITLLSGWDFKVDQLLFADKLNSDPTLPNRIAPNTAVNFVLVGWTLLLLDVQTQRGENTPDITPRATPAQLLILTIAPLSLLPIIGYAYGMKSLQGMAAFIPMALHTATTFLLLGLGLLFARPERGLMIVVASNTTGGATLRRLLLAACAVPVLLGWLRLQGQRAGWYEIEFGSALLVVGHILIFTLLLWWNAGLLYRKDSERRQMEDALRASEERLRTVVANLPTIVFTLDREGIITLEEGQGVKALGRTPGAAVGQSVFELYREVPPLLDNVRRALAGEAFSTLLELHGSSFATVYTPLHDRHGAVSGVIGMATDITERARAQAALSAQEERFKAFMNNSPAIAFMKDASGRYLYVNEPLERRFKIEAGDWLGKTDFELWPRETAQQIRDNDLAVLAGDTSARLLETVAHPDGSLDYWLSFKFPFRDATGTKLLAGIAIDVTEQKIAEASLRESEERFRSALDAMQEGLMLYDANEATLLCNQRAEQILGAPAAALIGQKSLEAPWLAVRENGSPFPIDEFPVRLALRTGQIIRDVVMGLRDDTSPLGWNVPIAAPRLRRQKRIHHEISETIFDQSATGTYWCFGHYRTRPPR